MEALIFLVIIIFIVFAVMGSIAAKKRREALGVLAVRLGLTFDLDKDHGMDDRYGFLDALKQGSNRYAYNILSGVYKGRSIQAFDYHYETHSTNSKGQRQTHHHHFSFFTLSLERDFMELKIGREGFFSKVAQAFGYDDIDFESHEFSRKFCVRSKDKKFAYDFCNAQMINYLLDNDDLNIEIERDALAICFKKCLDVEEIEPNLERLLKIRELMPDYIFTA